jgi:hypothetical protein
MYQLETKTKKKKQQHIDLSITWKVGKTGRRRERYRTFDNSVLRYNCPQMDNDDQNLHNTHHSPYSVKFEEDSKHYTLDKGDVG